MEARGNGRGGWGHLMNLITVSPRDQSLGALQTSHIEKKCVFTLYGVHLQRGNTSPPMILSLVPPGQEDLCRRWYIQYSHRSLIACTAVYNMKSAGGDKARHVFTFTPADVRTDMRILLGTGQMTCHQR